VTEFLHVALSFPTAPWTALLTLIAAAALLALLGAIDGISGGGEGLLDSLIVRVGLNGVPLLPVALALTLTGWLSCYLGQLLLLPLIAPAGRGPVAVALLLGSAVLGALAARSVARPLRRFVQGQDALARTQLLGRVAVVESGTLASAGRVSVQDGGAGLMLDARTDGDTLLRGERVILVAHDQATHVFTVRRADPTDT
jgi:membrane protein implicated in regulation of membrane protease activity